MSEPIRIGTRTSKLARQQAKLIQRYFFELGTRSDLVYIESEGDANTHQPIYDMGIQGVFTKTLDMALLNNTIDVGVHSMKDVPTDLAEGIYLVAVLDRHDTSDVLIYREKLPQEGEPYCVATSSLRRKAQWLNKYPMHSVVDIRGNVDSRLKKLELNKSIDAIILASAALKRLNLSPNHLQNLDWMIPAPAQGALALACRLEDKKSIALAQKLEDTSARITTNVERAFMKSLNGICTMPIAANAKILDNTLHLKAGIFSLDGKKSCCIDDHYALDEKNIGFKAAKEIIAKDNQNILNSFREKSV